MTSQDEPLILVDDDDNDVGRETKSRCHDGDGILHRAFSVFLFNRDGEVLLQQRASGKRLWPRFWSNSCCSHPRPGEVTAEAACRRIDEELSLCAPLTYLYKFKYQARFGSAGSEHELCHVFVGGIDGEVRADPQEVAAWRFVSVAALDGELADAPERFTPWLRLEWQRLRQEFMSAIDSLPS